MPIETDEIDVTELETFEPTRVDGVGKGANGFPILMLKSVDGGETTSAETVNDVLEEVDKSARPDCSACSGTGHGDKDTCSRCFGSGKAPRVGESAKAYVDAVRKEKGVAPSGQPVPPPAHCPTCDGSGKLPTSIDPDRKCPDCDGTGKDGQYNTDEVREGFGGSMQEGDPREKIDKGAMEFCDDDDCDVCKAALVDDDPEALEKKRLKYKERKNLPDSAFALPGRRYPIHDEAHARNALARVAQNGTPEEQEKVRSAVHSRYPDIEMAAKADGGMFTGPNPSLAAMVTPVADDNIETGPPPGSPQWEEVDAATAEAAAVALMGASELIRKFAQREAIEIAAGEGNDIFDTFIAEQALCDVSHALGIMAQMAFHEGLEAQKAVDDDVEKAGRRLSTKSVTALTEVRDHLTNLLGEDDPVKNDDDVTDSDASKSTEDANVFLSKEIDDMTGEELIKLLDERDKAARQAKKGKAKREETESQDSAHDANDKAKTKKPKTEDGDLEDEAEQGTDESASGTRDAEGGAKSVLTPEEIEAAAQAKAAKKALKQAKKMKKQAAENAAITRALEESRGQAEEAVKALEERLATVEGMAAPSSVVRTRPTEALKASAEKDALQLQITRYENLGKSTDESELRREYTARAKALRVQLAQLNS